MPAVTAWSRAFSLRSSSTFIGSLGRHSSQLTDIQNRKFDNVAHLKVGYG